MTCLRGLRAVRAALLALVVVSSPGIALGATGSQVYNTAGEHGFTVPADVTSLQVTLVGGTGGGGRFPTSAGGAGGPGATVAATLAATPGEVLFAEVGASGENGEAGGHGGAGGGGAGGEFFLVTGGGGGASDLRTCGLKCTAPSLATRLLVAGGGGGGGGEGGAAGVSGGPGGSSDRSGTSGSRNATLQGGQGGARATTSGGGAGGAVSYECPALATCSKPGVEGNGGNGGAGGGGGGGGGGIFGGGGGGGAEGFFEPVHTVFETGGGGGGGGGSSGVPAAGAPRVSGLSLLATALGAEPSIAISWTIPTATPPSGSSPAPGVGSGPASGPPATSAVAPVLGVSGLTVTPSRFRRGRRTASLSRTRVPTGATIAFALTRSATVTLAVEQPRSGVRAGARCLAPRGSARHARPCTRWLALAHTIVRQAHAGTDRIHFEGVLDGASRLVPGRYRLSLTASASGVRVNAAQHPGFMLLP